MNDSVARDEADRFFANRSTLICHPEDLVDSDNQSESEEKQVSPNKSPSDLGDDEDTLHSMSATTAAPYHVPRTFFEANTGPKGVIADAHNFNRAKKRSLRNTFMQLTSGSPFQNKSKNGKTTSQQHKNLSEKSASGTEEEDNDDEFMEQWRKNRLEELRAGNSHKRNRRQSPGQRKWGFFKEVDANEYLDVVEKSTPDTIVVVCIYDPEVCCDCNNTP